MQELLDGFYNVAMQLVQKIRRLKMALSDLDEVKKSLDSMNAEEKERFERRVRTHTRNLRAAISETEDMIDEAKRRLWQTATAQDRPHNRPHYAEMAIHEEGE